MAFCDLILAMGFSGVFGCQAVKPLDTLPVSDEYLYEFKKEEEKPKTIIMPPIVIEKKIIEEKEVVKEVIKEVEVKKQEELKAPVLPDPLLIEVEKIYNQRHQNQELYSIKPTSLNDAVKFDLPVIVPPNADIEGLENQALSNYDAPYVLSSNPIDNAFKVTTDRYISGILETGINSQLSGEGSPVVIQVSRDVYGYHGRNVLIPKGSRLVCSYSGPNKQGLSRSAINCERILLAGSRAEIWQAKAMGTDSQGNVGVSGSIDNRFFEKYGTAILLAGISASVRVANQSGSTQTSKDGAIASTGSEELSQRFGEITSQVLEQTINLKPILKIPQGTRLQLRPQTDWYIRRVAP